MALEKAGETGRYVFKLIWSGTSNTQELLEEISKWVGAKGSEGTDIDAAAKKAVEGVRFLRVQSNGNYIRGEVAKEFPDAKLLTYDKQLYPGSDSYTFFNFQQSVEDNPGLDLKGAAKRARDKDELDHAGIANAANEAKKAVFRC